MHKQLVILQKKAKLEIASYDPFKMNKDIVGSYVLKAF